jgi:fatty acid synthase subunit beta
VSSIYQVIDIAKKHPEFPVILQWTGGRGGGHHSYEDFHDPILETYHDIRQCENLILVAGSGFGSAVDIYPYLMGSWSLSFGRSALMPFDGFLFGSRVMLCKEAHTSAKVKEAIAAAEGVDNADWDLTYKGNAGGIVSVTSEMGQPIHVLATRGAMFWAEMDRTVFKLEKSKRQKVLDSKRNYIINKLNNDFQKVWFGQKQASTPTACEVEEMSYAEVLHRMVQLMFIKRQTRWIDDSYRTMLIDFLIRTEERFAPPEVTTAMVGDADGLTNPSEVVDMILTVYPAARDTLLRTEDVHYFKQLCSRPNQKPVPFVPALDGNFETWFKKDSLWQSENLEAVIDQDIGRTFVLQGPVAVRHSRIVDESVKDVMDSINFGTIDTMVKEMYNGNEDSITQEEYIQRSTGRGYDKTVHHSLHLVRDGSAGSIDISSLKSDELISLLAGRVNSWRRALFESENFVQGTKLVENPMRNLLSSLDADVLQIAHCDDPGHAVLTLCKKSEGGENKVMIRFEKIANTILVQPYTRVTANKLPVSLVLKYEYFPANGYAPIREVVEDRDQRIYDFYRQLWLGEVDPTKSTARRVQRPETASFEDKFTVDDAVVRKFNQTIGYDVAYKHEQVPMDLAIVLCWKPISQALLQAPVQGDLLKLVHLSNSFELARHAAPLAFGDELRAVAGVQSITIEDSGKILEIACKLFRSGDEVMTVTSRFLFRGAFSDFSCTFSRTVEQPMGMGPLAPLDVEILTSKPWIQLTCPKSELLNANLVFKLQNFTTYKSKNVLRKVKTTGEVFRRTSDGKLCPIGSVLYRAGESHGNPVISYLSRCGERVDGIRPLDSAAPMTGDAIEIVIPPTNEGYSNVSGDFNPIHTSPMFASYAGLPGTITHGMYCSAVVRQAVEKYAANQSSERVRKYEASFVGMVLPGDVLEVSFHHTAMLDGLKVVKIEVKKQNTGEKVLEGEAHVAQLPTTIVFTGQGSQEKNMGMELYETSTIARKVWDQADAYFENQFGLRITDIVRNNPTELTVYFGGITGRMLRENYMAMTYEVPGRDGILERRPIFPEIDRQTTSYSHKSPKGLLFATQFAQPALTIMELASFKDMDSKGLVPADSYFAGHSLGEYSALAAVTEFMPFERLLYIVFCRGLTMQAAVDRDALNRSSFGMIAVDPGRVSKGEFNYVAQCYRINRMKANAAATVFTDKKLRELVETLCKVTGYFVEIVNFNIRGQQYVCAGDLRALDCLQRVMDEIKTLQLKTPLEGKSLEEAITKHAKFNEGRAVPSIELRRGYATVPLPGVDVPFHSSFLLSRMEPFRQVLLENLDKGRVDPDRLVGKYIPNVTGTPFEITKEYFEEVLKATNSERVKAVLDQWETRWMPKVREEGLAAA